MMSIKILLVFVLLSRLFSSAALASTNGGGESATPSNSRTSDSESASRESQNRAPLYLEIGEQRFLSFPHLLKYSVSGDAVRYTRIQKEDRILVKAVKAGVATLYAEESRAEGGSENTTRVIRIEQKKALKHPPGLLQSLNHLETTEVIEEGDHFVLRGSVKNMKEAHAVAYIRDHYPETAIDETEIEGRWFEKSKTELNALLRLHPSLQMQTEEGAIFIRGGLLNSALTETLSKKIRAIQPLARLEIQTIKDSNPTLYFKVFLLEVKKEKISSIGVEWPETHGGSLQVTPLQLLFDQQIDLTIHTLSQKGVLKILSSPELVVRAPGQAELFAGGELPIRERSKYNDNIIWKNIGLSLKLDVKEFGGDTVRLNIETEMSHLDSSLTNDNIPGVQSNRIKTQVDDPLGKPLLLSGLLQDDVRSQMKGLPGLSSLPVLGPLFSSEDYQNDRSELVAVLLPHLQVPQNPLQRISKEIPAGYLPVPRNYLSPQEVEDAKGDKQYPWNAL